MLLDLTPGAFGLLLANLLPGVMAFYGLALMVPEAMKLLEDAFINDAGFGPLLLVLILSLFAGLIIGGVRSFLYEEVLFRFILHRRRAEGEDLGAIARRETLAAFRAAVEELLRYHQFWGSVSVALPLLYAGVLVHWHGPLDAYNILWITILLVLGEALCVYRAIRNYSRFVDIEARLLRRENGSQKKEEHITEDHGAAAQVPDSETHHSS